MCRTQPKENELKLSVENKSKTKDCYLQLPEVNVCLTFLSFDLFTAVGMTGSLLPCKTEHRFTFYAFFCIFICEFNIIGFNTFETRHPQHAVRRYEVDDSALKNTHTSFKINLQYTMTLGLGYSAQSTINLILLM